MTGVIAAVHQIILFFVNVRYTLLLMMEGERGFIWVGAATWCQTRAIGRDVL